jgi:hypothetical protein
MLATSVAQSLCSLLVARALAKLGKPGVPVLAQFQSCRDKNTVNIDTSLALELEQHRYFACVVGATAQHPATTAEYRAGEELNQPRRLLN